MSTKKNKGGTKPQSKSPLAAGEVPQLVSVNTIELETVGQRMSKFQPIARALLAAKDPKQGAAWPVAEGQDAKMAASYAYSAVRKAIATIEPESVDKFTVVARIAKGGKSLLISLKPKSKAS